MKQERHQRRSVLIVDDEPRIGRVIALKLGLFNYETITVTNGAEALKVVETRNPDVMLLDIVMPYMDGFQVLERLRTFSKLPVIAFSARPESGPKALELGASEFVPKPFSIDDMVIRVRSLLGE